jgi:hypothetical protein
MTVSELLGRVSSRELTEWEAYAALEPFGEERGDLRAGVVASVIANVNRDPKKRREPFEPKDFMPRFGETERAKPEPKRQTVTQQLAKVEELNIIFGGVDLRSKQ